MTKDMTTGSPSKLIVGFAVPLIFGNLFQQFYSMVDTIIVGRILGTGALAAVGSTGSINFLILGFCTGLCVGTAIPVAQSFGSKDFQSLRRFVGNAVWLSSFVAMVVAVVTVLLCRNILEWMSTPADIIDDAYRYIVIIFAGIPASFLYNTLAGMLRAMGDSRTPVTFLVLASVLNIGLDLLFILVLPMGVAGAALATVIAQLASGAACLVFIARKFDILHLSRNDLRPRPEYLRKLVGVSVPLGLQNSITAIGSVILQTSVNNLGSAVVASITAANKVSSLFNCGFDALSNAMANYSGQNMGAGRLERIRQGVRTGMGVGAAYSAAALVILFFAGRPLSLLFVDSTETVILDQAYRFLLINALFYVSLVTIYVVRTSIQGMGFSTIAMCNGLFEMVARGLTGLFLVPAFGFGAACLASPIAWIMADCYLIPAYHAVMRRVQRKESGAESPGQVPQ